MKKFIRIAIVPVLFFLFLFQNVTLCEKYHEKAGIKGVMWSDAYTYYEYLPATFIRNNISRQKSGLPISPGINVNKVTAGVAILEAPFFFTNLIIQNINGNAVKGYENSFGFSIAVAASFYAFLGLWMLFLLLKDWFNLYTAIFSVLIVFYGTNMFHYTYAEPGMSHVYSFFCLTGMLFFTNKFYKKPVFGIHFIALALFGSMAVLIRPTNIVMLLIFAGYNCYSFKDLKERFLFFIRSYWIVLCFALIGFLIFLPQILYWNLVTGHYFIFSYGYNNESFSYATNPKIGAVFFGHMAGWIPYSPVMLFSLITLPVMIYKKKFQGLFILIILLLITYICASWWAYNFLCAFGYRSFIEYYPLLIIPLAYLIHSVIIRKNKILIGILFSLIILCIYISLRLTFSFAPWPFCIGEIWNWDLYFKLIDSFFSTNPEAPY